MFPPMCVCACVLPAVKIVQIVIDGFLRNLRGMITIKFIVFDVKGTQLSSYLHHFSVQNSLYVT